MSDNTNNQHLELGMDGPRALRPEEHRSALRLIDSAFRPEQPGAMEREYSLVLGIDNIENMRVIVKDGEVISHTAIYFSTLRSADLTFKVGGISAVATHPDYRCKGLASSVLRDCVRVMRERGCHLSFLWTDRHDFYRSFGYEPAGAFYLIKPDLSSLSSEPADCNFVPYTPELLHEIKEIHDRESLRTERTAKEYETYFALPGVRALLAMRDGRVTAYAVMGKGRDLRGFMHDWGGDPQDLLCLVRELSVLSDADEVFVLAPTEENKFARLLASMGTPGMYMKFVMFSIINVEGVSSIISDSVSNRLGCEFEIIRDATGVKLKVGCEETCVEPDRMLVNVLFGPDSPSTILSGFSSETLSAMDKTFPIPLFIWGLDWV
jgi:predicted N-acetyltransferase YhbS